MAIFLSGTSRGEGSGDGAIAAQELTTHVSIEVARGLGASVTAATGITSSEKLNVVFGSQPPIHQG